MKRILLLLLLAAGIQQSHADDYSTFTLLRADNTATALTAVGTKIVFSGGSLVATSGDTTVSIALTDMQSMYFGSAANAISTIEAGSGLTVSTSGRSIVVTSAEGGKAVVASIAGQIVGNATITAGTTATVASNVTPGVYVIKVGQQTIKAIVR